jgi:serine/threonine protein kinase
MEPPTADDLAVTQLDHRIDCLAKSWSGELFRPGEVIANYRVERELGRGGMGVVFLAVDLALERRVALKVIHPSLLTRGFRERFQREARTMAQVSAPEVLTIHAFGEQQGVPYFAMEYVEGVTLEEWLFENPKPDIDEALAILDDVCKGVAAVHAAGAIHRDIKPSNVLLDVSLHARVADLGLVASAQDEGGLADVAGTPAYMSPELTRPRAALQAPSPRSDVYALACVAFEVLTGRHPFFADDDDAEEPEVPSERLVPLASHIRTDLPAVFDGVLAEALANDPARRTPTAELFRERLLAAGSERREPARILVAEDDDDFLELVRRRLTLEFPSTEVECVHDGSELVEAFDRNPSSVVIVDLCMPAVDGFQVTSQLRSRVHGARVPIIVLTGAGGARDWATLSALGADRFLVKPIDLDDLMAVTRRALVARSTGQHGSSSPA